MASVDAALKDKEGWRKNTARAVQEKLDAAVSRGAVLCSKRNGIDMFSSRR